MRASEIIGGLSVLGVVVLIGLAIADDADSGTITTPTAPTILAPVESTPETEPSTSETITSTASTDAEVETTEPPAESDPPETSPETTAATTTTTTTIPLIPVESRPDVRVRVVNAGAESGGATFTSGILEGAGFTPVGPADGVANVAQNTILYAPGQGVAALTVNESINAAPEFVLEATPEDPNWAEFGSELDVLVVIGPA